MILHRLKKQGNYTAGSLKSYFTVLCPNFYLFTMVLYIYICTGFIKITRMTTFISSEALRNYIKDIWKLKLKKLANKSMTPLISV